MPVFEDTTGLKVNDDVEFTGELLSVELGPGLLTQVFDGLQNPLPALAEQCGFFLQRGTYLDPLPGHKMGIYTCCSSGRCGGSGDTLGTVPEGLYEHQIMVPFSLSGKWQVRECAAAGEYTVEEVIALIEDESGNTHSCKLMQTWPVKIPISCYTERLRPTESMATKLRTIDTFSLLPRAGHIVSLDHSVLEKQFSSRLPLGMLKWIS